MASRSTATLNIQASTQPMGYKQPMGYNTVAAGNTNPTPSFNIQHANQQAGNGNPMGVVDQEMSDANQFEIDPTNNTTSDVIAGQLRGKGKVKSRSLSGCIVNFT